MFEDVIPSHRCKDTAGPAARSLEPAVMIARVLKVLCAVIMSV